MFQCTGPTKINTEHYILPAVIGLSSLIAVGYFYVNALDKMRELKKEEEYDNMILIADKYREKV